MRAHAESDHPVCQYTTGKLYETLPQASSKKQMADDPILIIQMQRLGDIVLTYPLMGWLRHMYRDTPVWILGEEAFYSELTELSPSSVYFSYEAIPRLKARRFSTVINLSHRPEAAEFAGSLVCDTLLGPYRAKDGRLHVRGNWQLYRTSLVHNNRYNLFHWADLHGLDLVPKALFSRTSWPLPRAIQATTSAHIGLFLGASEPDKHPDERFWVELAGNLLQAGHRPVLLGGKAEKSLGAAVAKQLGAAPLNLTGHFSVSQLCRFLAELDLMVTPDTGPMHLAAWTGTPVLNISTGPVNAWETGPFSPGHYVLRASLPCVNCWQCTQGNVICKERLHAGRTAFLIHELMARKEDGLPRLNLPGQELLVTARDDSGLYLLRQLTGQEQSRQVTARFWQAFFGHSFGLLPEEKLALAWKMFIEASPGNATAFASSLIQIGRSLAEGLKPLQSSAVRTIDFWRQYPLPLRPLTSYIHMLLQNDVFSKASFARALELVERLAALER